MIQKDGAFYMDNYFEMEAAQKSNYRRLRQLDKKQKHSIVRDDHCAADFVSDDVFEADRCVKRKPCVCVSDG